MHNIASHPAWEWEKRGRMPVVPPTQGSVGVNVAGTTAALSKS